eukprot:jgi/Tetstr1/464823/TSEL_009562.t1
MMAELRRLWCLLDSHGIYLRARYIRWAANVWADRLTRHLDIDDWQLDPLMFLKLESQFGPHHSIDRFASALNTLPPLYNAAWLDPTCEAVDSLNMPDAEWPRENNWCNALLAPATRPRVEIAAEWRSGDRRCVAMGEQGVAPCTHRMVVEELTVAPHAGLFRPGRRDGRDPRTMARYVTWLGNPRTIKAFSLHPYLSAVNNFFKDHGREPMAPGEMVSRVRKDLAASHVTLYAELMRPPLPVRVVLKAPTLAKALRLELGATWGTGPASAHADIAELLHYFDAARNVFAGGRVSVERRAINRREGQAKWTADTRTS